MQFNKNKNKNLKTLLIKVLWKTFPFLFINLNYFRHWKKFPNLKKPKNISEIILSTIYSGKVNEYSDFADKVKVREYFIKWGFEEYLPKIFGIWDDTEEINFDALPSSFALKTNNGCGNHYICPDKKELNVSEAKSILNLALGQSYGLFEPHYKAIKPVVYCEEYINDGSGFLPTDYKFMCVGGEVKCTLVVTDRSDEGFKLLTYNKRWEKLDFVAPSFISKIDLPKPQNLTKMIKIAEKISKKFEFVRVDFFETPEQLFLGELTFTPWGGNVTYFNSKGLNKMGY